MQIYKKTSTSGYPDRHPEHEHAERIPMHPDDFKGLLAWIMAKQSREPVPEKPVFSRRIG